MASERFKSALLFTVVLLIGIGLAFYLYFYQIFYKADRFLPGVKIASVTVTGYSKDEAAEIIQKHIEQAYNAPISFYNEDYIYNTNLGYLCSEIDIKHLLIDAEKQEKKRSLLSKVSNMDGAESINYSAKVQYDQNILSELLDEWNKALGVEAVNARLEVDLEKGLIVLPSKSGSRVDEAKTFSGLPQHAESFESLKIPIVMTAVNPQIQEDVLKDMGELAAFSTWFNAGDINRSHNLYLAASSLNGCMISPGKVWSFNEQVGKRVSETGYRDALVIVDGKFEPGLGGGICQVSSTLYNAVLLAGLQIIERHNHALTVAYVPVGRDATVVYEIQDFRFKNNTSYPIYIRALARGGSLRINIYGNLAEKKRVELSTFIDQTIAFKESRQLDSSLQPGEEKIDHVGFPGYVARSYRSYLDHEGKIIKRELLATDYYKPLDKLILAGPDLDAPEAEEIPPIEEGQEEPVDTPPTETEPLPHETIPPEQIPPVVQT
ncbi:MAG: VanW family protein [Syntrophomonadaceae bacterium]|nr:VanW family protein [Syntrophomonadaceae bacterium]MDD3023345.1 VanW family protein [Syntrophomonadaceae bacterium]